MNSYNLFLFFFVISVSFWSTYALNAENLFGGININQLDFKFHVTVLAKANDNPLERICSAGLLKAGLLLSIASCFLNSEGKLKPLSFFAVWREYNPASQVDEPQRIVEIYVPRFEHINELFDISVSRLDGRMQVRPNKFFARLKYFLESENQFDGRLAHFAGCEREQGTDNILLKFVEVEILGGSDTREGIPQLDRTLQDSQFKLARLTSWNFGLNESDTGSPITIGTQAVGLVIKVYPQVTYLALNTESIVGGLNIHEFDFRFHVTILARANDNPLERICSAGLIKVDLLLSLATCFLNFEGNLKPLSFLAVWRE